MICASLCLSGASSISLDYAISPRDTEIVNSVSTFQNRISCLEITNPVLLARENSLKTFWAEVTIPILTSSGRDIDKKIIPRFRNRKFRLRRRTILYNLVTWIDKSFYSEMRCSMSMQKRQRQCVRMQPQFQLFWRTVNNTSIMTQLSCELHN
jgi:hypothetical protein